MTRALKRMIGLAAAAWLASASAVCAATDHETLVNETHRASLAAREQALRNTIAKDSVWPHGVWGEVLWSLAALHLNEKTEIANARLLKRAEEYIAHRRANLEAAIFKPENPTPAPWTYFALTDYVRILHLFHAQSRLHPGRLKPETEAAMVAL